MLVNHQLIFELWDQTECEMKREVSSQRLFLTQFIHMECHKNMCRTCSFCSTGLEGWTHALGQKNSLEHDVSLTPQPLELFSPWQMDVLEGWQKPEDGQTVSAKCLHVPWMSCRLLVLQNVGLCDSSLQANCYVRCWNFFQWFSHKLWDKQTVVMAHSLIGIDKSNKVTPRKNRGLSSSTHNCLSVCTPLHAQMWLQHRMPMPWACHSVKKAPSC